MILRHNLTIFILVNTLLFSCNNIKNEDENIILVDTTVSIQSELDLSLDSRKFDSYKRDGYIFSCDLNIFNTDFLSINSIKVKELRDVKILERTVKMINPKNDNDICNEVYYVKIVLNSDTLICNGNQVFEKLSVSNYNVKNSKGEGISIFPIANMKIGVTNEDGLTSCPQETIYYLVKNNASSKIEPIGFPVNDTLVFGSAIDRYAVLQNNEWRGDSVFRVSVKNDSLYMDIKVLYQEAAAKFQLVTSLNSLKYSYIRNNINYDSDDYMEKYSKVK